MTDAKPLNGYETITITVQGNEGNRIISLSRRYSIFEAEQAVIGSEAYHLEQLRLLLERYTKRGQGSNG